MTTGEKVAIGLGALLLLGGGQRTRRSVAAPPPGTGTPGYMPPAGGGGNQGGGGNGDDWGQIAEGVGKGVGAILGGLGGFLKETGGNPDDYGDYDQTPLDDPYSGYDDFGDLGDDYSDEWG